ncbi:unnamed protein product [Gongylonema pulchrum]|uniref:Uncharacterized protein n=1 Tax=Gongylonema pulchrum TaxID=637853 RepID=A0A183DF65_9BILA|nr:unnamed protein product [Gongylonema pulchrum]
MAAIVQRMARLLAAKNDLDGIKRFSLCRVEVYSVDINEIETLDVYTTIAQFLLTDRHFASYLKCFVYLSNYSANCISNK